MTTLRVKKYIHYKVESSQTDNIEPYMWLHNMKNAQQIHDTVVK